MANWKEPKSNYTSGSSVTPDIFNTLAENEKYLNITKITTDDVQNATVKSAASSARTNLAEDEMVKGAFGKIRKWFTDLRALAFKSKVDSEDINSVTASKVTGLHAVATSGDYNQLNNKPSITKTAIGLDNVANERQYSANTPPPYPVTSVNGKTGAVTLDVGGNVSATGTYPDMTVGNARKINSINIRNESGTLKADEYVVEKKKLVWSGNWVANGSTSSISTPGLDYNKPYEIWVDVSFDVNEVLIGRFMGDEFEMHGTRVSIFFYTYDEENLSSGRVTPSDYGENITVKRIYQILT